ncbi:MAG TPA: ABC transporter substrate-binding protein [Streptosporangiaceae bacterium]|jgi:branched-chain amino acid transport system substrate-binding protein
MKHNPGRLQQLAAVGVLATLGVAACGTASSRTHHGRHAPIIVGATEPLTGQFSADGIASLHGLELWASDVNEFGGLLGRPVRLKILNDNSGPGTVTRDYTKLITQDHVDLTVAPFSSLLTVEAAQVTRKYHYALPDGSGGAPSVYALNDPWVFGITTPVVDQMVPFADWILSLPPSQRPTSAAYPMVNDPFADPPVENTEQTLSKRGIKTVYYNVHNPVTANASDSNLASVADRVAAKDPQLVVLGTVDVPSLLAFVHAFQVRGFTPKIFIASSGPDQGEEFLHHIGPANAEAMMVLDGWFGGVQNALSHVMVQDYIAKFGGTTNDINADVAEAYSAGEILATAVTHTGGLNNTAIDHYLHTHTVQTVQGAAKFTHNGTNIDSVGHSFIFQWQNSQFRQVLPAHTTGSAAIEATKPRWQTGQ